MEQRKRVFSALDSDIVRSGFEVMQPRIDYIQGYNYGHFNRGRTHLIEVPYDLILLIERRSHSPSEMVNLIRSTRKRNDLPNTQTPIIFVDSAEEDIDKFGLEGVFTGEYNISWSLDDDCYFATSGELVKKASEILQIEFDYVPKPRRGTFNYRNDRSGANPNFNLCEWE